MIVILNALMLFFGFSGEMGWIKNKTAVGLGFIPFIAYFYLIYENFAKTTETGIILFWVFTAIWSLYGFSALAPYAYKNISYNILDLISKNLMEVYLSVILLFSIASRMLVADLEASLSRRDTVLCSSLYRSEILTT